MPGHWPPLPGDPDYYYADFYDQITHTAIAYLRAFDVSKAEIKYEHILGLYARFVEVINKHTNPVLDQVMLLGRASRTGSWEYNEQLMKQRAVAAGLQLFHLGVPQSRFSNRSVLRLNPDTWEREKSGENALERAVWVGVPCLTPPDWLPQGIGDGIDFYHAEWVPPSRK